jgi:hypothetical protein
VTPKRVVLPQASAKLKGKIKVLKGKATLKDKSASESRGMRLPKAKEQRLAAMAHPPAKDRKHQPATAVFQSLNDEAAAGEDDDEVR